VQPEQESVERRVVPGARGDAEDLFQPSVREGPAGALQSARLGHASCWVVGVGQDAVGDGLLVQAPQSSD
jgi:hypothetical protein